MRVGAAVSHTIVKVEKDHRDRQVQPQPIHTMPTDHVTQCPSALFLNVSGDGGSTISLGSCATAPLLFLRRDAKLHAKNDGSEERQYIKQTPSAGSFKGIGAALLLC